jgi:carbon monoxide dehydrogenase subunit G
MGGRLAPMEYRVSALEPMRRVVLTGSGSGVSAIDEIRFERSGTGTHIDYTADIRLGGLLRLVQPFLGGPFRKIAKDALAGMQTTLSEMSASETAAAQQAVVPSTPARSSDA